MITKKYNRYKPLYKKFISLRKNISYNQKILNFNKKKWQKIIFFFKRSNKTKNKIYKIFDLNLYFISKFGTIFKKQHKYNLQTKQKINLFYGGLKKKYLKKLLFLNLEKNKSKSLMYGLENRLDTIIYRSHFSSSLRTSRQLISHGHILVNKIKIKNSSYKVQPGDNIEVSPNIKFLIKFNIGNSSLWPLPPKNLSINYKTLQINYMQNVNNVNLSQYFPFWADWNTLSQYYKK